MTVEVVAPVEFQSALPPLPCVVLTDVIQAR